MSATQLTPRPADVLLEQIRVVGLGLRREATLLAAVLASLTLLIFVEAVRDGEQIDFEPGGMLLIAIVGLLLPFAVWKADRPSGGGYMWTLPVNRARHALARSLAGLIWLLLATVALSAWLLVLALLTGGGVGGDETRFLATGESEFTAVRWTTAAWEWITPFTAGPLAYLLGTAFVLGLPHPVRTAAALSVGLIGALILSDEFFPELQGMFTAILSGPLGVDAALSGGTDTLAFDTKDADGRAVTAWRALPSAERWLGATALWTALGVAGLWAALFRHREH